MLSDWKLSNHELLTSRFSVKIFSTYVYVKIFSHTFFHFMDRQPGLTSQRHSALISSDSEYFQVCFSAVHYLKISAQRWFSSEQRWKRKFSELKISAETALIFSETADSELNSPDFLWIVQNDDFWLLFDFFQNFSKYLILEAHNFAFPPSLRNDVRYQNLLLHFCTGQWCSTSLHFWVYCYCSSNKTDMVQLFKNIFSFYRGEISRWFQKKCVFTVNLQNFYPFLKTGIPF